MLAFEIYLMPAMRDKYKQQYDQLLMEHNAPGPGQLASKDARQHAKPAELAAIKANEDISKIFRRCVRARVWCSHWMAGGHAAGPRPIAAPISLQNLESRCVACDDGGVA